MTIRRLLLPLLIAALVIPAAGIAAACCGESVGDQPRLAASGCCCPAECVLQAAPCDAAPDRLDAALPAVPAQSAAHRPAKAVSPSRVPALLRLVRAPDPPSQCLTSRTSSCHGVSLPLRL